MDQSKLSPLAETLISAFEKSTLPHGEERVRVNALVAKVASWYEKLRNAMDYREEEVVLRAAIERILKRRLLLGGKGSTIAEPLIRELVWARYIRDENLEESIVKTVEEKIDAYLLLKTEILSLHKLKEGIIGEWMYHLLSSDLEYFLNPQREKEIMSNFMYQILKGNVSIVDDDEQIKDVQVFIAVRKSFAKDDIAFLRFHLFQQYFGALTKENVSHIAKNFLKGYEEIQEELNYPRKDRIYTYTRNKSPIFLVFEDILRSHKGKIKELVKDREMLKKVVFEACDIRYQGIASKVRRAIVRSVLFILLTKVFFAFAVEGTVENILYGKIFWSSILLNTTIPPLLMVIISIFIRTPSVDNSEKISRYIQTLLFDQTPNIGDPLVIRKHPEKAKPFLNIVFTLLWFLAFVVAFGLVVFILSQLHFRWISQVIFLFFLTIVSFLSYRISLMSKVYTVDPKQGLFSPIIDFLFMPIVRVGRHLTEGISQINIFLFIFDFIIETPFKGLFAFIEQWFFFLNAKREELG